jgi:hypothetical protein
MSPASAAHVVADDPRDAAMEPGRDDREDGSLKSYRLACGYATSGERSCPTPDFIDIDSLMCCRLPR